MDIYLFLDGRKIQTNYFRLFEEVNDYGVSRLIYTDINVMAKQSPNFEETQKVADNSSCPVVISGGVSSINDKKSKSLKNIEGIIFGKTFTMVILI